MLEMLNLPKNQQQQFEYCKQYSFDVRGHDAQHVRTKYPDRIPIIIQCLPQSSLWKRSNDYPVVKYLVPVTGVIATVKVAIRSKIKLTPEYALNYLVDSSKKEWDNSTDNKQYVMLNSVETFGTLDKLYCKPDGFVYIYYDEEHAFG